MKKTLLIIEREYFARVNSRPFLLISLLVPLMITAMILSPLQGNNNRKQAPAEKTMTVQVIDPSGLLNQHLPPIANLSFEFTNAAPEQVKQQLSQQKEGALLHITATAQGQPGQVILYTKSTPSQGILNAVKKNLFAELSSANLKKAGIDEQILEKARPDFELSSVTLEQSGEKKTSVSFAIVVGIACAVTIYFFIFFYGVRTLHAIAEEKANRISEIIISSVRSFELMMGKIAGITLAVFTQILLVAGITLLLSYLGMQVFGTAPAAAAQQGGAAPGNTDVLNAFGNMDLVKIIICFVIYFIVGFLLYAAVFAAIGAAMDPNSDTLQFIFPVLIPLIFSLILIPSVFNNPNNSTVFWASFVPFTSPVVMMLRLPFGVPWWQLLVSMTLLLATFLFVTFLAGRIYRVGILMYGTKPGLLTIGKWLLQSN